MIITTVTTYSKDYERYLTAIKIDGTTTYFALGSTQHDSHTKAMVVVDNLLENKNRLDLKPVMCSECGSMMSYENYLKHKC